MLKVLFTIFFVTFGLAFLVFFLSMKLFNKIGSSMNKKVNVIKSELEKGEDE